MSRLEAVILKALKFMVVFPATLALLSPSDLRFCFYFYFVALST